MSEKKTPSLSRYVLKTIKNDQEVYWHTVLKRAVPASEVLSDPLFIAGSEEEAIRTYLTRPIQRASFTIINTWECNLRCTHCTVASKLLKQDTNELDLDATIGFLKKFKDHHDNPTISAIFLGGEPLLKPEVIRKFIVKTYRQSFLYGITTNLAVDLSRSVLKCLKNLHSIGVSLDGLEESHNEQRRPLYTIDNPFQKTLFNIVTLVKLGLRSRINVQAALRDEYLTPEHTRAYYRLLMKCGIKPEQIKFSCVHPTERKQAPTETFLASLKSPRLSTQPCCKYRLHNYIIDINGTIYSDYYTWTKVGTIQSSISEIMERSLKLSLEMPALSDQKCRECPVIGYCWGGCTNGQKAVGKEPSKYCDQENLITTVQRKAQNGILY